MDAGRRGDLLSFFDANDAGWRRGAEEDHADNLTSMQVYDYGNLSTPARTYTNTYLTASNYTSRYIYNRLVKLANVQSAPDTRAGAARQHQGRGKAAQHI